jgi:uncharacterized protein (TIGR02145 family)
MSYQAVIRNASNALVVSTQIGMQITVLKDANPVYVETHTPTTNANGLVNIEIGAGSVVTGTFSAIDWSTGTYYLKTETDPSGGVNYTAIVGTSQLLSAPYALYAKSSGTSSESSGIKQQIMILEDNLIAAGTYKLSDVEGNQYNVVKIGTQVWMKENLQTTKYNDGLSIPNVTDNAAWAALTTGAYSDYSNTPGNSTTYGRLYNWYAVDNNSGTKVASNGGKNVCPTGWHVPTDAEWTTLTTYLGGESVAGGKLKETGTSHWIDPNTGATNTSGFTALPGGTRNSGGYYGSNGVISYWLSSSEYPSPGAWIRYIIYDNAGVSRNGNSKASGLSVRCVRDF